MSFGPVGIVLAGAAGAGLGALLGKMLFGDDDRASFDFGAWNPLAPQGTVEIGGHDHSLCGHDHSRGGAGPTDPEQAARDLADAYRRYRRLLSEEDPGAAGEADAARSDYEAALDRYRSALSADR